MEIKVTNFILVDHFAESSSQPRLEFIHPALQEFKKLKTPINTAYNIVKSIKAVEEALSEYNKIRISILESLCDKDENEKPIIEKNNYKLSDEARKEWSEKWQELLNTEITIDIWQIKQSDIAHLKEINIACYETLMRYKFIIEDEKK